MRLSQYISNLICEGGATGHMPYPYDYDMSEYELIDLIRSLFGGKIDDITEKIDGLNIQASVSPAGQAVFIRNKSDLNSHIGGMTMSDMESKWASNPSVQYNYLQAGSIISEIFENIPISFFYPDENTRRVVNCECVVSGITNVIPYGSDMVSFHDIWIYKRTSDGWAKQSVTKDGLDVIEKACSRSSKAKITSRIIVRQSEESATLADRYESEIKSILRHRSISEFKKDRFMEYIDNNYQWINQIGLSDILYDRWINGDKSVNMRSLKKIAGEYSDDLASLDKNPKEIVRYCSDPLDTLFINIGNDIISLCSGFLNTDVDKAAKEISKNIENAIDSLRSDDQHDERELIYQMNRISKGGSRYNGVEGIVFNYKGRIMKLTGSFGPINKILGFIRFKK